MALIEIYSSPFCGFCYRAKHLLDTKKALFKEIDVSMDADRRAEMEGRSGGCHTVPQIFINDMHVGGCDELYTLEAAGELDQLLAEEPHKS